MLSQGQAQVETAQAACQAAADALQKLAAIEAGWKAGTLERLARVQARLHEVAGRFFLKTKLCLPFATQCAQSAQRLAEAVGILATQPGETAQQSVGNALDVLEKAVRTLEERANMQGMVIT